MKDANFTAETLKNVKGPAEAIKGKGFPTADPAAFWDKLAADHGLSFEAGGKGKLNELGAALKKLGGSGHALVYLYKAADKTWHTVAVQLNKAPVKAFDPYQGEFSSADAAEIGAEIARVYPQFDGFVISKIAKHAAATVGPVWDWDFDQGKMIGDLENGRYVGTRAGGKTIQDLFPAGCGGICCAMSYDWLKMNFANKSATSAAYNDPKKFVLIGKNQKDGSLDDLPAAKEGFKLELNEDKASTGPFNKATKDLIFKIDQRPVGFYILNIFGPKGGHWVAFQKTGKETGKFFDPNIGQCTIHAGGESVGALIGAVLLDLKFYKDHFVDAPTKPGTFEGTYGIGTMKKA